MLYEQGMISSEATLRRMYRRLSKSVHPDMMDGADGAVSHERFVRLKADYDAASLLLAASEKTGSSPVNADTNAHVNAHSNAKSKLQ